MIQIVKPQKQIGGCIMKKKLLSVLLSAAMVATLLTGCGSKTEEAAPAEEAVTEEAPAEEAATEEVAE